MLPPYPSWNVFENVHFQPTRPNACKWNAYKWRTPGKRLLLVTPAWPSGPAAARRIPIVSASAGSVVYRCLSRNVPRIEPPAFTRRPRSRSRDFHGCEAESAAAPEIPEEFQPDQLPRALFGYDRSTIVELLGTLSRRIKSLTQERTDRDRQIAELEATIKQLEATIKQNEENHRLIGEALVAAREEANTIRENARQSAEQVLVPLEARST